MTEVVGVGRLVQHHLALHHSVAEQGVCRDWPSVKLKRSSIEPSRQAGVAEMVRAADLRFAIPGTASLVGLALPCSGRIGEGLALLEEAAEADTAMGCRAFGRSRRLARLARAISCPADERTQLCGLTETRLYSGGAPCLTDHLSVPEGMSRKDMILTKRHGASGRCSRISLETSTRLLLSSFCVVIVPMFAPIVNLFMDPLGLHAPGADSLA